MSITLCRKANLIRQVRNKSCVNYKTRGGNGNGKRIGNQQAQYLTQSGISQIPNKRVAHALLYQGWHHHQYLQGSSSQYTIGRSINTYSRNCYREEQPSDQ